MKTARLIDISDINPRLENAKSYSLDSKASFVPMAAVSEISGSIVVEEERSLAEVFKGFTYFQNEDVLIAKITPCFENGKIAQAKINNLLGFGSTEFHVVRANTKFLDSRYLFHFLRQKRIRVEGARKMTGSAGQRRVPKNYIENLRIPLPPLEEQKRVAAILDKADALREKRRRAITKLDTLLQSVFLDMFGDPVTNPKGWRIDKLASLCEKVIDCPHSTPHYSSSLTPFACLRSSDIQNGFIEKSTTKYVNQDEYIKRIERETPQIGDVIYCREGARFGNAARILTDELVCLGQRMMLFRAAAQVGTAEFIWAFLNFKSTYKNILRLVGGSASPHINVGALKSILTIIPPFRLQQNFSHVVKTMDRIRVNHIRAYGFSDSLFYTIQQRAFNGELFSNPIENAEAVKAAMVQQGLFE